MTKNCQSFRVDDHVDLGHAWTRHQSRSPLICHRTLSTLAMPQSCRSLDPLLVEDCFLNCRFHWLNYRGIKIRDDLSEIVLKSTACEYTPPPPFGCTYSKTIPALLLVYIARTSCLQDWTACWYCTDTGIGRDLCLYYCPWTFGSRDVPENAFLADLRVRIFRRRY